MLPKYILNDVRQILYTTYATRDYELENSIIRPIYEMVFHYRASEVLKQKNTSFVKVVDTLSGQMSDKVNHPSHYGSEDNPYEAIKVIEAWGLGFCDGNAVKYLCRWKQKGGVEDLK